MKIRTCVSPDGFFHFGTHKPQYVVENLRHNTNISELGAFADGSRHTNIDNFPPGRIQERQADWVYEIPNPFSFRGTTYIAKSWADPKANDISKIRLASPPQLSMSKILAAWQLENRLESADDLFNDLPEPVLLTLAANSTDPADLIKIAQKSCEMIFDEKGIPAGLKYHKDKAGISRALITDHDLFEIVANNPCLPDPYKEVMVLRPGAQGGSEIIGEFQNDNSHVFEYLRRNSYIPWGHFAANMANDSIRYNVSELNRDDMNGMRHLYYQRTYTRLAGSLGIAIPVQDKGLEEDDLENLRKEIGAEINNSAPQISLDFDATLWGWNYGFDCAASRYKLHASHQMIHQQFALLPSSLAANKAGTAQNDDQKDFSPYACGDLVEDFICRYKEEFASNFFADYIDAIYKNRRTDERQDLETSLIVFEDEEVILFVPKAQTSQWELQLMTLKEVGNIIEADKKTRDSLNQAIYIAMKTLTGLGAKMITSIEFSKRFSSLAKDQRLLYSFLPKLPYSPGAFSEAQMRFINGHYPEDFARACRAEAEKQGLLY